ncbi:MAG TPA: nucleotidyltransferase family protein [Candidatus Methanoperedenaceae archaeon]|nr:nucleotidyltransferase family protein [Candidatus Methanoperedenaceae archaeon]
MDALSLLGKNTDMIKRRFGVVKIGVFGSYARREAGEESDVDVLVEFEKGRSTFDNFMDILFYLEELLGKKVDLITTSGLDRHIRPYVEKEVVWL